MADLRDPRSYVWPGDAPRYFVEVEPPRRTSAWRWWEESFAPTLADLFPTHEGSGCRGLLFAFAFLALVAVVVSGVVKFVV